jgi:hypothetical protein
MTINWRIVFATICSPLIAGYSAVLSMYVLSGRQLDANESEIAWKLSVTWFVIFFAPFAFILLDARRATLVKLTLAGAVTGAMFSFGALFLVLSMMGHGGTSMNVQAFLLEAALLGATVGTVVGGAFSIIGGLAIRSRRL